MTLLDHLALAHAHLSALVAQTTRDLGLDDAPIFHSLVKEQP